MLVRLTGKNFRSFKDEFELSMVAAPTRRKSEQNYGVAEVPVAGRRKPLRLLRVAALYGPNASGKSNVLRAADALEWWLVASSRQADSNGAIRCFEPFALQTIDENRPIELGLDVTFEESLLRFEIGFTQNRIEYERLVSYNDKKRMELLIREAGEPIRGTLFEKEDRLRFYTEDMQPHVSAVAKLAHLGPQAGASSIVPYFHALRYSLDHNDFTIASAMQRVFREGTPQDFAKFKDQVSWAMENLIRPSDTGIIREAWLRKTSDLPEELKVFLRSQQPDTKLDEELVVHFIHQGEVEQTLQPEDESAGTRKLLAMSPQFYRLAHQESALFADELSVSLHPTLLTRLVRLVNDPDPSRDRRSQLIFATHDTGLMESSDAQPPALRRDQIYFTRKDNLGRSELYSLTEFKDEAREVHNIRRRYLLGAYGAIPELHGMKI